MAFEPISLGSDVTTIVNNLISIYDALTKRKEQIGRNELGRIKILAEFENRKLELECVRQNDIQTMQTIINQIDWCNRMIMDLRDGKIENKIPMMDMIKMVNTFGGYLVKAHRDIVTQFGNHN